MKYTHKITLINDDIHDYDYVIACLMKFCKHDLEQAEQCALITDKVGKCDIKIGNVLDMYTLLDRLENLELTVQISECESNMRK